MAARARPARPLTARRLRVPLRAAGGAGRLLLQPRPALRAWEGFTLDWYARPCWRTAILLASLRNSLIVALLATTVLATAAGHGGRARLPPLPLPPAAGRWRRAGRAAHGGARDRAGLLAAAPLRRRSACAWASSRWCWPTSASALSYAVVVVRARLAGFDRSLEEAAMDLGAGPVAHVLATSRCPAIAPGVLAAALLVFALSIDDYVVTSFVAGVGATTLPLHIYSMVKSGVSPGDQRRLHAAAGGHQPAALRGLAPRAGARPHGRRAAPAALAGLLLLGAPFLAGGRRRRRRARAEPVHLVRTTSRPRRSGASRSATACASTWTSTTATRRCWPRCRRATPATTCSARRTTSWRSCCAQGLLRPLDHSRAAAPRQRGPALPGPALRSRQPATRCRTSGARPASATGEPQCRHGGLLGRALGPALPRAAILMLDDARETFGAALKRMGHSLNTTDPGAAASGPAAARRAEAAGARLQLLELRGRAALRRRVAGPGLERPVRQGHGRRTPTSTT